MAAAAYPATNLEADDVMDLSSDSGQDFDGDIELDIELAHQDDDDVSIKDAFADPNDFTVDPDDFMADSDDDGANDRQYGNKGPQGLLVPSPTAVAQEEQAPAPPDDDDLIDYGVDEVNDVAYDNEAPQELATSTHTAVAQGQPGASTPQEEFLVDYSVDDDDDVPYEEREHQEASTSSHTAAAQEQPLAPPVDDDLIDYSDEEDEPPVHEHASAKAYTPVSTSGNSAGQHGDHVHLEEEAAAHEPKDQEQTDADNAAYETNYEEHHYDEDAVYQTNDEEHREEDDAVHGANDREYRDEDEFEADNEASNHTEGEDGGVLEDPQAPSNLSENQADSSEDQQSIETRHITVNYEGNELWLFKQHDTENSGDWLVDDISLVHSSLSDLFQACRASLGEDISNETELGLRFDHFHNMELFEDSTACVAVSLERLVHLYHTLHAQDGESDPESFYMCLLSRPRFATLLSDVAKHAEQGSGYAGLNSAVAAGETHFADMYSGHSTEHEGTDWDNEAGTDAVEKDQQQNEGTESTSEAEPEVEPEVEHAEHPDQHATDSGVDKTETKEVAGTEHDDTSTSEGVAHLDQDKDDSTSQNDAEGAEESTESKLADQVTPAQALASEHEEQLAHDTVDYSDQEDEDELQGGHPDASSLSSATVQGDKSVTDGVSLQAAEPVNPVKEEEENDYGDADVTVNTLIDGHDGDTQAEEQFDHGDNAESYQDYAEAYDQNDPFNGFQMDAPDAYTEELDYSGLTNQDFTGYEYQDLDQQLQDDFTNGAEFDDTGAGESTNIENDISNGDDILGLDNAPEWSLDQEPTSGVPEDTNVLHEAVSGQAEEGDGVVVQPEVAASSAADPVAASSAGLHQNSPQGTKRSIDEVDDSVDDALDFADMKRPRV